MTRKCLLVAIVFFAIGFLVDSAITLLHIPAETAQMLLKLNWVSGGLCFVALSKFKDEI
jgi:hypothetical protein